MEEAADDADAIRQAQDVKREVRSLAWEPSNSNARWVGIVGLTDVYRPRPASGSKAHLSRPTKKARSACAEERAFRIGRS